MSFIRTTPPTMAAQPTEDQRQPFLEPERDSFDIELSHLDGPRDDRTPEAHYNQPKTPPAQGRNSPWLIAAALLVTVIGFVINTESTEYVESELGWKKPFATMYITHSSLALPWICYITYDRFANRHTAFDHWYTERKDQLIATIETIDAYAQQTKSIAKRRPSGPLGFLLLMMGFLTFVLTASGVSWFIALAWTTPADLTAIYNCSTFFAAAFSVPLLKEKLGLYSILAVALSLVGTFVIAYGDTTATHDPGDKVGTSRLFGNLVASCGALAFGLYEVLFKKWACSPKPIGPGQSMPLTLAASALTGFYTFATVWIALVFFHFLGIETFVWPSLKVWMWIIVAVLSGSVSITMLAVLVVWTDPVFGSFANVLSVFFVALSDWLLFGLTPSLATYAGGGLVMVAFSLLTWDTFYGNHR